NKRTLETTMTCGRSATDGGDLTPSTRMAAWRGGIARIPVRLPCVFAGRRLVERARIVAHDLPDAKRYVSPAEHAEQARSRLERASFQDRFPVRSGDMRAL